MCTCGQQTGNSVSLGCLCMCMVNNHTACWYILLFSFVYLGMSTGSQLCHGKVCVIPAIPAIPALLALAEGFHQQGMLTSCVYTGLCFYSSFICSVAMSQHQAGIAWYWSLLQVPCFSPGTRPVAFCSEVKINLGKFGNLL